ncbi:hypothetical protein CEW81_18250 [Kluyvera genomosp. 3]|uniref:Uncharacterized protein n=1 Tax=Kluyvera genomosp. 3 TaxID=2774055 RepID=A0A248KJC7_9ENTR|nr:hypothetical protein CEW81_18250 [Kluyvera genomosp. 3]
MGNNHIAAATLGVAVTVDGVGDHTHAIPTADGSDGWSSAEQADFSEWGGQTSAAGAHSHTASGSVTIGAGDGVTGDQFINPHYGLYIWVRTA